MTQHDDELAALRERLFDQTKVRPGGAAYSIAVEAIDLAVRLSEENRRLVIAGVANDKDANELRTQLASMKTHGSPHGD